MLLPNEQFHGLGTRREPRKNERASFRRFWVKEACHSETISDEKKNYLYRSTRPGAHTYLLAVAEYIQKRNPPASTSSTTVFFYVPDS